jgi:glycosyltransferase involved in cell wall biosynthesis
MYKKIAYILPSKEIGGTEKMTVSLAKNIKKYGFDCFVITLQSKGEFTHLLSENNIKSYTLNLKKNIFRGFIKFVFIIFKEKPSILHSFLFWGNLFAKCTGSLFFIPVICSQRSTDDWKKPIHWYIEHFTSFLCKIIISNSLAGKNVLVEKGKINSDKIIVIPNGIDINKIPAKAIFEKPKFFENKIIIGSIGNLRKAKGYEYLLKSIKIITEKYKNIMFIIAGKGKEYQNLLNMSNNLNISEYVKFVGFIKEIYSYISFFDILVIPSLWEGFPVIALEAMAMKKPIVATNSGDIPIIINNGSNGLIVEPKDPSSMANAIIYLLNNPQIRQNMGENGYKKIIKEYTLDKMVQKYAEIYKNF